MLKTGDRYRLVSAPDFFGEPLLLGKYDSDPLRLPMRPRKAVAPIGMSDFKPPATEPEFGAYVALRDEGSS